VSDLYYPDSQAATPGSPGTLVLHGQCADPRCAHQDTIRTELRPRGLTPCPRVDCPMCGHRMQVLGFALGLPAPDPKQLPLLGLPGGATL